MGNTIYFVKINRSEKPSRFLGRGVGSSPPAPSCSPLRPDDFQDKPQGRLWFPQVSVSEAPLFSPQPLRSWSPIDQSHCWTALVEGATLPPSVPLAPFPRTAPGRSLTPLQRTRACPTAPRSQPSHRRKVSLGLCGHTQLPSLSALSHQAAHVTHQWFQNQSGETWGGGRQMAKDSLPPALAQGTPAPTMAQGSP